MKKGKETGLYKAEKGLSRALKIDHKADAGVKANLKEAMNHVKKHMAPCKKT